MNQGSSFKTPNLRGANAVGAGIVHHHQAKTPLKTAGKGSNTHGRNSMMPINNSTMQSSSRKVGGTTGAGNLLGLKQQLQIQTQGGANSRNQGKNNMTAQTGI